MCRKLALCAIGERPALLLQREHLTLPSPLTCPPPKTPPHSCTFVLCNSRTPELLRATMSALHVYLSWVPLGYIFESTIVNHLLALFPQPPFRNVALQCLTEVGAGGRMRRRAGKEGGGAGRLLGRLLGMPHQPPAIPPPRASTPHPPTHTQSTLYPITAQVGSLQMGPEFDSHFESFYKAFMVQLGGILPAGTNIAEAYERGNNEQQAFVQNLALFFTGFFKVGGPGGGDGGAV